MNEIECSGSAAGKKVFVKEKEDVGNGAESGSTEEDLIKSTSEFDVDCDDEGIESRFDGTCSRSRPYVPLPRNPNHWTSPPNDPLIFDMSTTSSPCDESSKGAAESESCSKRLNPSECSEAAIPICETSIVVDQSESESTKNKLLSSIGGKEEDGEREDCNVPRKNSVDAAASSKICTSLPPSPQSPASILHFPPTPTKPNRTKEDHKEGSPPTADHKRLITPQSKKGSKHSIPIGVAVAWQRLVTSSSSLHGAPSSPTITMSKPIMKLSATATAKPKVANSVPCRPSSASPIKLREDRKSSAAPGRGKEGEVKRGAEGKRQAAGNGLAVHSAIEMTPRPISSSSVPPNIGISSSSAYFPQSSLLEYHHQSANYGMRSVTPFPQHFPPTWQTGNSGFQPDLNVPQGYPSGAYLQQTMHNMHSHLQLQSQLFQQYQVHPYSSSTTSSTTSSSSLMHHYNMGYEALRHHYEQQIVQQQQQSDFLRHFHHHHSQQQQQLLLTGGYEATRATPTTFPPSPKHLGIHAIPLLSPSPTEPHRTTPNPHPHQFHQISNNQSPTSGLLTNWPSADLYHHNSSAALSPKSLTSSSPSPVTVQSHSPAADHLHLVNTTANMGKKCSTNHSTIIPPPKRYHMWEVDEIKAKGKEMDEGESGESGGGEVHLHLHATSSFETAQDLCLKKELGSRVATKNDFKRLDSLIEKRGESETDEDHESITAASRSTNNEGKLNGFQKGPTFVDYEREDGNGGDRAVKVETDPSSMEPQQTLALDLKMKQHSKRTQDTGVVGGKIYGKNVEKRQKRTNKNDTGGGGTSVVEENENKAKRRKSGIRNSLNANALVESEQTKEARKPCKIKPNLLNDDAAAAAASREELTLNRKKQQPKCYTNSKLKPTCDSADYKGNKNSVPELNLSIRRLSSDIDKHPGLSPNHSKSGKDIKSQKKEKNPNRKTLSKVKSVGKIPVVATKCKPIEISQDASIIPSKQPTPLPTSLIVNNTLDPKIKAGESPNKSKQSVNSILPTATHGNMEICSLLQTTPEVAEFGESQSANGPTSTSLSTPHSCDNYLALSDNKSNTMTFIRDSSLSPLLQPPPPLCPTSNAQAPVSPIKPKDNHLDLLATVAQEFGSREDLRRLASSGGSRGSSLMTSPVPLPSMQSPEINFPTPVASDKNASATTRLCSLPSAPSFPSKSSYDEYEYDEREGGSTSGPQGSYKHPVWLKIPQVVPQAAAAKKAKKDGTSRKVRMSPGDKKIGSPSSSKPVKRPKKDTDKPKLKIPKISPTSLEKKQQLSPKPRKSKKQGSSKKDDLVPLKMMTHSSPTRKVAKLRIKLNDQDPSSCLGKTNGMEEVPVKEVKKRHSDERKSSPTTKKQTKIKIEESTNNPLPSRNDCCNPLSKSWVDLVLTPPPTAPTAAAAVPPKERQLFPPSSASKTDSHSTNGIGISPSDLTYAVSAIRQGNNPAPIIIKPEKPSHPSPQTVKVESSEEDEEEILMDYERRSAEKMRQFYHKSLPTKKEGGGGMGGEVGGGKKELAPFVSYPPKHHTHHHHIKPCLKPELIIRSPAPSDEDSDAEIDFEVAELTGSLTSDSVTQKGLSMLQQYRKNKEEELRTANSKSIKNVIKSVNQVEQKTSAKRRLSSISSSSIWRGKRRLSLNLETGRTHIESEEEEELPDIPDILCNYSSPANNYHEQTDSAHATDNSNQRVHKHDRGGSVSTSAVGGKKPKKRQSRSHTTSSRSSVASSSLSRRRRDSMSSNKADGKLDETLLPGKTELEQVGELVDGMRILTEIQGLFYTGKLKALQPPDVYGVTLDNERGNPPHLIFSAEEVLEKCIREKKPQALTVGLRICAYWSPQYSGLYPGRVSIDFNSTKYDPEKDLVPIEFDDGDTGMIKLGEIRMLPTNHPIREYDPNPLLTLEKKQRKRRHSSTNTNSGLCTGDHEEADCGESYCAKVAKLDEDEAEEEDEDVSAPYKSMYWTWTGLGFKKPKCKKSRNKEFFRGIQRGDEVINVGDSAIFISHGNERPYIGRIEQFWEKKGQKVVNVRWFYHPEEVKSPKRIPHLKHAGALFESPHIDENDVQTIARKCEVLPYPDFKESAGRMPKLSLKNSKPKDLYYVAGFYDPYTYNLQVKI